MPKKLTQQEYIQKSKNIFGDQLDYSKIKYINGRNNIILICKKHGEFTVAAKDHISYKRGCSICSGIRYNNETFLLKAKQIHGNKYIYNKTIFTGIKNKIIIICKIHGEFNQTADKHINAKQGCPKCKKSSRKNLDYFIARAKEINGDTYDYSKVNFTRMSDIVEIICIKHGSFWQTPTNHITCKNGCLKCHTDGTRIVLDEFKRRCELIHGDKYDYSKVIYVNSQIKVEIICPKHGSFWQKPLVHAKGSNCSWCVGRSSKKEAAWLNYMMVPEACRNITLYVGNKRYMVDAYDIVTNTIYEFYGDYWHGNPKIYHKDNINKHNKEKFSDLYIKTIKRKNELICAGYKFIYVWESDFDKILRVNKNTHRNLTPSIIDL